MNDSVTTTLAEPPVRLAAKEGVRIRIVAVPSALGACGPWEATVRAVVIFSDGAALESPAERITDEFVDEASRRRPTQREILAALRHVSPVIRTQAVKSLGRARFDGRELAMILSEKLKDPDVRVRAAVSKTATALQVKAVGPALLAALTAASIAPCSGEWTEYLNAVEQMRPPRAAGQLADMLSRSSPCPAAVARALIALRDPRVPDLVRPLFARGSKVWLQTIQNDEERARYEGMAELLITYRDSASQSLIGSLMVNPSSDSRVRAASVRALEDLTPWQEQILDPFVLAFRKPLEQMLAGGAEVSDTAAVQRLLKRMVGTSLR